METIADRLQTILKERNLKQTEVVKMAEPYFEECKTMIEPLRLGLYVRGIAEPSKKKISLLAKTLNVSEDWLLGYSK